MKRHIFLNKISAVVLSLYLLSFVFCPEVTAAETEQTGSIRIWQKDRNTPISSGSMALYQVACVVIRDGAAAYELTQPFQGSGIELGDLQDPRLPGDLEAYARRNDLPRLIQTPDNTGMMEFTALEPGVYLIVQETTAEGYLPISPFLVTIPFEKNGEWVYDVDATPKTQFQRDPTQPTQPETPTEPDHPKIPQTGQLAWPVPVLAGSGVMLFLFGWAMYFKKEGTDYET